MHTGSNPFLRWRVFASCLCADLLRLNDALERFAARDPEKAQLVKLRYFAGLTIPQAAEALGISSTTADRHWAYARAWLHTELSRDR